MLATCFETSRIWVSSLAAPSSAVAVPTDAAPNASTHAATANARLMYPSKAALLRPQLPCARNREPYASSGRSCPPSSPDRGNRPAKTLGRGTKRPSCSCCAAPRLDSTDNPPVNRPSATSPLRTGAGFSLPSSYMRRSPVRSVPSSVQLATMDHNLGLPASSTRERALRQRAAARAFVVAGVAGTTASPCSTTSAVCLTTSLFVQCSESAEKPHMPTRYEPGVRFVATSVIPN